MKLKHIPLLLLVLTCCPACQNKKASATKEIPSEATYTNPLLAVGAEPWAVFHEGKYYYTQGAENKIILWETNDITDLEHAARKEVWIPKEISPSNYIDYSPIAISKAEAVRENGIGSVVSLRGQDACLLFERMVRSRPLCLGRYQYWYLRQDGDAYRVYDYFFSEWLAKSY